MKRSLWLPLAAVLTLGLGPVHGEDAVRGFDWGASPETVRAAERARLIDQRPELLTYRTRISSLGAALQYSFGAQGLDMVVYLIAESYPDDPALYVRDYERLQAALVEKYGEPMSFDPWYGAPALAETVVVDRHYTRAVMIRGGHVESHAEWQVGETHIHHALRASDKLDAGISHVVVYKHAPEGPGRDAPAEEAWNAEAAREAL